MTDKYERGYTCGEEGCLTRIHLETALFALVRHCEAADQREGLPYHCIELQNAIDVLHDHCGYQRDENGFLRVA